MASTLTPKQQQLLDNISAANIASQKRLGMTCIAFGLACIPLAMIVGYALGSTLDGFIQGVWMMLAMLLLGTARLGYVQLYEIIQKLIHSPADNAP